MGIKDRYSDPEERKRTPKRMVFDSDHQRVTGNGRVGLEPIVIMSVRFTGYKTCGIRSRVDDARIGEPGSRCLDEAHTVGAALPPQLVKTGTRDGRVRFERQ